VQATLPDGITQAVLELGSQALTGRAVEREQHSRA
jgi:hypothetical protein